MIPEFIKRDLLQLINERTYQGKAIIILGPRQSGKSTLLKRFISDSGKSSVWLNCDDPAIRDVLSDITLSNLKSVVADHQLIVIDEAQRIKNVGLTMKLITDEIPGVQLLASGSSALELTDEINEPLTGRKWEYFLYPISWKEFQNHVGFLESIQQLNKRLVFGMYPDMVTTSTTEKGKLAQLAGSYLYKDILNYKGIRKPELLDKLLKALAYQLGNEVSYNELSRLLQVDRKTIEEYVFLLEQAFIIKRLPPLSRNLRSEINTSRKIYFWDNGIRNAILGNYEPIENRMDAGALWENFMIIERMKMNHYAERFTNYYFWRTHAQQEIDFVEERDGKLVAFEFKLNPKAKYRFPKTFDNAYPHTEQIVITPENFHTYLTK